MKQVLVVRKDLNMRKGKMCAQCAHASLRLYLKYPNHPHIIAWLNEAFTKIVVSVDTELELVSIYEKAKKISIPTTLITDAGNTEFNEIPTLTVVAVGPAPDTIIDIVTGHLKLL